MFFCVNTYKKAYFRNDKNRNTYDKGVKRMKLKTKIFIAVFCVLICALGVGYYAVYDTVYERIIIEVGTDIDATDFAQYYSNNTVFVEDISEIDNMIPGTYKVYVKNTIFVHECELVIVDTVNPEASSIDVDWYMLDELLPELCVTDVFDSTDLTYEFLSEIDMDLYEKQAVEVLLTDVSGNETKVISYIRLIPLVETLEIEVLHEIPDYTEFLLNEELDMVCMTDLTSIDNTTVQNIEIEFDLDGEIMYSTLIIQDTVAPTAEAVEMTGYLTSVFDANDFVTNIIDDTEVTVSFVQEIDVTSEGSQTVWVALEDGGGNITEIESTITLEVDTEAPIITCQGDEVRNIVGEAIAYKQSITATDNCDETINIEFDNSEVDINTAGEYNIYCTATDVAGNTTSETFTVVIYEEDSMEAKVYEMADAVLETLIDEDMSEYEIVEAIYWYCKWNISYTGTSDKSDWITGAYNGLKYHSGDCFTYATVAKVLLTRAGITNMDISKIPAATQHFWNLVDLGDGWVHFDSCARSDGTIIFLWTTEELLEYSDSHNLSHNFDPEEYPELYE